MILGAGGNNFWKDQLQWKSMSKNLWPRFARSQTFILRFPKIPLLPPQNDSRAVSSQRGSRTHQCKEPQICKAKTFLQKYRTISSNFHLHSHPDSIQLYANPAHKNDNWSYIQPTRQAWRTFQNHHQNNHQCQPPYDGSLHWGLSRHHQGSTTNYQSCNAQKAQTIHCNRPFNRSHGDEFFQCLSNYTTQFWNHCTKIKNCGHLTPPLSPPPSPGGQNWCHQQAAKWHAQGQLLVHHETHRCCREEISI